MKNPFLILFALCLCLYSPLTAQAGEAVEAKVVVLVASNKGNDFNLVNDEYKDQLIKLFSYTSYQQLSEQRLKLPKSERVVVGLPEGYELVLTYQGKEESRSLVQALIRKQAVQYVFTVLSMMEEGVAVLGGPPTADGDLVIVLEKGF